MKNLLVLSLSFAILVHLPKSTSAQVLKMASGVRDKGWSKLTEDIIAICGDKISLEEVHSNGGLDNLGILASKEANLGFVGVDVLSDMKNTDDAIASLKVVMELNNHMLHIIASRNGFNVETKRECSGIQVQGKCMGNWIPVYQNKVLEKASQMKGRTVAAVGSAQVLAQKYLNSKLNMNLTILDIEKDGEAFALLKSGKVQAVLTMAPFPNGPIAALKPSDNFMLTNWDLEASGMFKTVKKNYRNLGTYGITFLYSKTLLMARPVDPNGDAGRKITQLKSCIISNLPKLKDMEGFQPSWADVNGISLPEGIPVWPGNPRTAH